MFNNLKYVEALDGKLNNLSSQEFSQCYLDCYIPITQSQYTHLKSHDNDFFCDTKTSTIFSCGTQDAAFVIMPLAEQFSQEVMEMQL